MTKDVQVILVPTDFSELSCQAFSWAAFFAEQFAAKILLVHVISEAAALEMIKRPGNPWEKVLEREDQEMIENFKRSLAADLEDRVEIETFVGVGMTGLKVVEIARKKAADMIVMATHGRTGISHVMMGSVAEQVVQRASCPVFTVRPE